MFAEQKLDEGTATASGTSGRKWDPLKNTMKLNSSFKKKKDGQHEVKMPWHSLLNFGMNAVIITSDNISEPAITN